MGETNGNGFPLSMKVAYAKDLLVAKVAESPEQAVSIVKMLITALALEEVALAGPKHREESEGTPDDARVPDGPVMERSRVKNVSVKTGNGKRGPWTRYGILCEFTGGDEKWLNTFDLQKGKLAESNKGKYVLTSYSPGKPFNGEPTYNLDEITELKNQS